MDRFIVREPRVGADYPQQGNQMMQFPPNTGDNNGNVVPETMYFGGYGAEFPVQRSPGFMGVTHVNTPHFSSNLPSPNQMISGIDPRYLAAYADNSASYISGNRQQMERDQTAVPSNGQAFATDYQNRTFIGADRNTRITFCSQVASSPNVIQRETSSASHLQAKNTLNNRQEYQQQQLSNLMPRETSSASHLQVKNTSNNHQEYQQQQVSNLMPRETSSAFHLQVKNTSNNRQGYQQQQVSNLMPRETSSVSHLQVKNTSNNRQEYQQLSNLMPRETSSASHLQVKNTSNNRQEYQQQQVSNCTKTVQLLPRTTAKENDAQKTSIQLPVAVKTKGERLRDLHKTGIRVFSGPVEKVLKWHKSLQELGVVVLYEIVAKCVSVRNGESCSKTLVVRDDSGPAMQIVYYEIDFLLPELKPPCTVRVIGRMMQGTCRLQAFSVRQATGDDVSTLPRRAAVAAHHVSKLCKEYGNPI